ncbi:hypothetical protein H671_5g14104 [Cricetulus griseus]|nr:hypothetical protein H671_5g14104 [Cricetulus griseus]
MCHHSSGTVDCGQIIRCSMSKNPIRFVYMVNYIDGFFYVEPSLHFWDEANLIMMDNFSNVFLDSICQYFVQYF